MVNRLKAIDTTLSARLIDFNIFIFTLLFNQLDAPSKPIAARIKAIGSKSTRPLANNTHTISAGRARMNKKKATTFASPHAILNASPKNFTIKNTNAMTTRISNISFPPHIA